VDAAAAALADHPDVYERGGEPVQVARKPGADPAGRRGVKRAAGAPQILALGPVAARTLISRLARFWGFDRREGRWVRRVPPRDVAEGVIHLRPFPGGRPLVAVVEAPTLRPDGSLLTTPGYDRGTGLLYLPNARYPAIPAAPSRDEVERAAQALLYLVQDFPFRGESDRAVFLALVLTLVARGAIVGPTPAFLVTANVAGAGKTTLVVLASRIATGRPPAFDGYAEDDAEMEKRLGAVSMIGDPLLLLDNARNGGAVGGPALDRAILIPDDGTYRARILGKSEMSPPVPWRTVIAVTGNNLGTKDDALRRFVPCFLLSPLERPETRDPAAFAVTKETGLTLDQYVTRERPRLVAAALTILRGYLAAGRSRGVTKDNQPLTPINFDRWEGLVRQAVYYATGVDPCASRETLEANDRTTQDRHRVVAAWRQLCHDLGETEGLTARQGAEALNRDDSERSRELRDAFPEAMPRGITRIDSHKLGYLLRRHRDAATPHGTLKEAGKVHQAVCWAVAEPARPGPDLRRPPGEEGRTGEDAATLDPGDGDSLF
jgi:hypothetical protein